MRLFLDANIIVSVINKEYPLFPYSSRILSQAEFANYHLFTTPVSLAIAFYFAEKKSGTAVAKQKIKVLSKYLSIAGNTVDAVAKVLEHTAIEDFEDGLQYYAAKENKCHCIITQNVSDFYFSDIEVITGEDYYNKHMMHYRRN